MQLERLMEAMHSPEACLTYTALTGARKQSVSDAERLFSASVVSFMERKGYTKEEQYLCVVLNWRRACDERGLSEPVRSRYNYDMLNFILKELMPYHGEHDYSHLEVNK